MWRVNCWDSSETGPCPGPCREQGNAPCSVSVRKGKQSSWKDVYSVLCKVRCEVCIGMLFEFGTQKNNSMSNKL
jgi:hypothetical protein